MRPMLGLSLVCALMCLLAVDRANAGEGNPDGYPERWNSVNGDFGTDEGLAKFIALLKESKNAGCTHIMVGDGRWLKFPDDKPYIERVQKAKAAAKELNLTLLVGVASMGYSGRYFHFDANLAAGLPVKEETFIVKGKTALPDPALALDTSKIVQEGDQFIGNAKMRPFTNYMLTCSMHTDKAPEDMEFWITSSGGKRRNGVLNPVYTKEGDHLKMQMTFNSLEGDEVKVRLGNGKIKITDLKIESAGLLLIVRRQLVPLTVTSEDGKTVYEEGKDFEKIIDPCLAQTPFPGETTITHKPAEFKLTEGSRIKDGEKLKLTFWHTQRIYTDQDCISLEDPKVMEILETEFTNAHKIWNLTGYMLGYDEIRMGGFEPQPDGKHLKPGELLAAHFKHMYDFVKKTVPDAKVYTWSDMFTPYHNAFSLADKNQYYYLVNGNWDGSWEGVPKDVIILNWYAPKAEGVKFFADRGNPQIIAGYYDGRSEKEWKNNIAGWKKVLEGQPNILGFMYTTWNHNYKNMQPYFKTLDTFKDWGAATTAKPVAEPGVK